MSKGYDDFFKAARQTKATGSEKKPEFKIQKAKSQQQGRSDDQAPRAKPQSRPISEAEIRAHMKSKTKSAKSSLTSKFPPFKATIIMMSIFGVLGFGYSQPETVEGWLQKVEILPMTSASAADEKPADAKAADTKAPADKSATNNEGAAKTAETGEKGNSVACVEPSALSEEDLSHFKRLSDRKKELDLREQELNALEEELHKQRDEVEARIVKLDSIRGDISTVLKDRVEVDEERVKTLVEFYSNMKPKQAADIVANLNEDLAVEVLGKMKKKNAAEIMNLLPPEKARTISEKFTGYKRR